MNPFFWCGFVNENELIKSRGTVPWFHSAIVQRKELNEQWQNTKAKERQESQSVGLVRCEIQWDFA
jgi:hypothetical protein